MVHSYSWNALNFKKYDLILKRGGVAIENMQIRKQVANNLAITHQVVLVILDVLSQAYVAFYVADTCTNKTFFRTSTRFNPFWPVTFFCSFIFSETLRSGGLASSITPRSV